MVSDKRDDPPEGPGDPDEAPPDDREGGFGSRSSRMLGDLARRALMTGIGAVFMSEETLKNSLSDMKLPKEAMGYVVAQADRTKKEIVAAIARETREFLAKLELDKMIARALVGNTIEISTRIRVVPHGAEAGFETTTETKLTPADDESPKRKRKKRDDLA